MVCLLTMIHIMDKMTSIKSTSLFPEVKNPGVLQYYYIPPLARSFSTAVITESQCHISAMAYASCLVFPAMRLEL